MKPLINKAAFFGLSLVVLLLCCGENASGAEKRKPETAKPAPKAQIKVTPVRAETNPEYLKRLADPEFNPELVRPQADPGKRMAAAQTVADQFCQAFTVASAMNTDAQGCYLDLTVTHNYSFASGGTNAFTLPHGFHIKMCPGIKITSVQTSGAWFAGSTFGSTPSGAPWDEVWWTKACLASGNYSNVIPSGVPLQVRLRIPGLCASTPCPVTVEELTGWAHPNLLQFWSCRVVLPLVVTQPAYSIGPDIQLCKGDATKLTITPAPSATAQVTWYKSPGPCPPANCAMLPLGPPWVVDQVGGNEHYTNKLDDTTCYVAVIKDGCIAAVSNPVKKIEICPGPPQAAIGATPDSGYGPPNQDSHVCGAWKGQLCLDKALSSCLPVTGWTMNGQPVMDPSGTASTGRCIDTGLLKPGHCSRTYEFKANMKNACGPSTATWKITVDGPPKGGTITANPTPPLCYDRATMLTHKTPCGKVVQWEKREETTPCSNFPAWPAVGVPIPGSQGTSVWWTGDLQKTTEYRVLVDNGACPPATGPGSGPVYSQPFTVTVKPKLTVSLSANNTVLCAPGSVTLTASHSWGPPSACSYLPTFQWYRNGVLIPGASQATYVPTTGGNYHVVVNGQACGKAKSKVITVCDKPKLVITGDCCVCSPTTPITLTATTLWSPKNCQTTCNYKWTGPGVTGATTQTVQALQSGVYSVTVDCGGCQLPPAFFKVDACASPATACVLDAGITAAGITFPRRITLAQTFTPTQNGSLTKITHGLRNTAGSITNYDLLVTTTIAGLPTWTAGSYNTPNVLFKATGLAVFASSSTVNAVVTIPAGQEPCLTAGTQYALILIPGSPTTGDMQWRGNSAAGSYPNGSAYELTGTTWTVPTTGPKDHGFKLDGVCPCL